MNAISDGVVIGVVLGLIFAAVSYYLYSRIGQLERKVGVMENILLDLKITTEQTLLSATEPAESAEPHDHSSHTGQYQSFEDEARSFPTPVDDADNQDAETSPPAIASTSLSSPSPSPQRPVETREMFVSEVPRARVPSSTVQVEREKVPIQVNYEAMTYKELRVLAQQKGVSGLRTMSKAQVIDALKGNPPRQEQQSELSAWTSGTVNFGEDGQGQGGDTVGSAQEVTEGGALEEVGGPELSLVSDS
jgi:hypothetical protein